MKERAARALPRRIWHLSGQRSGNLTLAGSLTRAFAGIGDLGNAESCRSRKSRMRMPGFHLSDVASISSPRYVSHLTQAVPLILYQEGTADTANDRTTDGFVIHSKILLPDSTFRCVFLCRLFSFHLNMAEESTTLQPSWFFIRCHHLPSSFTLKDGKHSP